MKKILLLTTVVVIALGAMSFGVLSPNGKAGYTNSPSEGNCTTSGCHSSYTVNTGAGSTVLSSTNMTNWEYTPGTTYHMILTVKYTGRSLFGLGLECLTTANANAGTLVITNSAQSKISTKTVGGVSRKNVVQQQNGGVHADSMQFVFDWTAPTTNIGNVKFYFSGMAADNSGNEAGDYVYTGSQTVTPASTVGVQEVQANTSALQVINLSSALHLTYSAKASATANVELYDIKGSLVNRVAFGKQNAGNVELDMPLTGSLKSGVYIVKVIQGSDILTKKAVLTF